MTIRVTTFSNVEVRIGVFKVEWQFTGDGRSGVYDPKDSRDKPLLRFVCFMLDPKDREWRQMEYGSYLTELPTTTQVDKLLLAGQRILELLQQDWPYTDRLPTDQDNYPYRDRLMLFSHISLSNFEFTPPPVDWSAEALLGKSKPKVKKTERVTNVETRTK